MASDFVVVFNEHAEHVGESIRIPQFYRIREFNPQRYQRLTQEWQFHVDLVADLALEMTRAVNLVLSRCREAWGALFMAPLGYVSFYGPSDVNFVKTTYLPTYSPKQAAEPIPYGDLDHFKRTRHERAEYFAAEVDDADEAPLRDPRASLAPRPEPASTVVSFRFWHGSDYCGLTLVFVGLVPKQLALQRGMLALLEVELGRKCEEPDTALARAEPRVDGQLAQSAGEVDMLAPVVSDIFVDRVADDGAIEVQFVHRDMDTTCAVFSSGGAWTFLQHVRKALGLEGDSG